MSKKARPRLRTVEKIHPPFPLNRFPPEFALKLGKEIVYLLTTKGTVSLEGGEWEQIFAICIGADWKPSNVGLDDIILDNCAWGAKTVKHPNPSVAERVRLISGRNSTVYSFGATEITTADPDALGAQVLEIWNERVAAIRKKHPHLRTVVLIKGTGLAELVIFEFETIRYDPELYEWTWNKRGNLEGYERGVVGKHSFTWQPHGSQFTIIEDVPEQRLVVSVRTPERLDKEAILKSVGFDKTWVKVRVIS